MKNLPKLRAALYLAAVFLAGVVVGGVAGYTWGRPAPFRPPPSVDEVATEIAARYQKELGLSEAEVERFRPIAAEVAQAMVQLHHDVMHRVIEQFHRTHEQLATWLTPEQLEKLRAFEARERRKFSGEAPPP
jgi:2-hydroxychromene-2-carboxylate isomerase